MTRKDETLPVVIGTTIEMAMTWLGHEILAPGAGFAVSAIGRYLLGRRDAAAAILRSELERMGATGKEFRDANQFAAGALRYMRAARDQAGITVTVQLIARLIGIVR